MIQAAFPLESLEMRHGDPARLYRVKGSAATVGVITSVTQHGIFSQATKAMREIGG